MTDKAKTVLSATADTILDKAIRVDVDVLHPRWWERIAMRFGWLPAKRTFYIKPATLGNMIRISKLLLQVDGEIYQKGSSALEANYQVYEKHGVMLSQVIATAITNSEQGPDAGLVKFIQENLTAAELLSISSIIIRQLDVVNFMSTIISIRGMSLLNPGGKIASGELSGG